MATYIYRKNQVEKYEADLVNLLRERDLIIQDMGKSDKVSLLEEKIKRKEKDLQGKWDRLKNAEERVSVEVVRLVDDVFRYEGRVSDDLIEKVAEASSFEGRSTFTTPYVRLVGESEEEVEYLLSLQRFDNKLGYELGAGSIRDYREVLQGFGSGSVALLLGVIKGFGL